MALLGWVLVLELMAIYGIGLLRPPIDAFFLMAWGLAGTVAGFYGLAGNYWQKLAWVVGFGWYMTQLIRYIGVVEGVARPDFTLPQALGLLYIVALPVAWSLSIGAVAALRYWWPDEDE